MYIVILFTFINKPQFSKGKDVEMNEEADKKN